jgi:multiple sugar transport system substrate-binding protein
MKKLLFLSLLMTLMLTVDGTAETNLTWWQFWTDPAIKPTIDSLVAEFETANPDIDVEVTDLTWANGHEKIVIAFASGTGPDIVELGSDWIAQFAANDQLADLTESVAAFREEYDGWGMATYDSAVYAVPWILGTRVLFANREYLNAIGKPAKWVPLKLEELKDAVQQIDEWGQARGVDGWGANTAEKHRLYKKFLPFFWSYDAQLFTDENKLCVISSVQAVDALKLYKEMHDNWSYVGSQREIEDAFLDGKIGFIFSGDWLLKRIELENRKIDFVTTLFPGLKFNGTSFMGGEFLAVNGSTEHREEALRFIRFVTSPRNQLRFCVANRSANPSSEEAQNADYFKQSEHLQVFISQLNFARHSPVDPEWVQIEDIIERKLESVLFEDALPASTLREAQIEITKLKKR